MPKVAADNSPLLERVIFGYDGTAYRVVKVDTDGNLVAAIKATQTIEVTQDTAADLKATVDIAAGQTVDVTQDDDTLLKATVALKADQNVQARNYGWINAAWQKNPLLFGVSGQIVGNYSNLNAVAGTNNLDGADVPAGEMWLVRQVGILNENTGIAYGAIRLSAGGTTLVLKEQAPMTADRWLMWEGDIPLIEGDNLIGNFQGCTLNDNIYMRYLAVRVDIDQ